MVKVFISHQRADSLTASNVALRLKTHHGIDCYLDVIDPYMVRGEELATHIRTELSKCTQLLTVMSGETQKSWWVPWEIGVASEKEYPLATYSDGITPPPEYLKKWPYLRNQSDLDHYARVSKSTEGEFIRKSQTQFREAARTATTRSFYGELRRVLGQ